MGTLMRKFTLLFVALSFIHAPAWGDTDPTVVDTRSGCKKYLMCDAQTTTGVCTKLPSSGEERILRTFSFSNLTFYSLQSVGAHTCNIFSNDQGYDAASGVGKQINVTSLNATDSMLSFQGSFDYVWVECPTIGTSATVTLLLCTANR